LQVGDQIIAYAQLWESRGQREFKPEEIALCQGIAQQAAIAIRNAQLHDEIRQQAADLSTLYTVTRMASRSLVLEDVLSRALSSALLSLGFEAGLISLTDPTDGRLHLAVEHGLPARYSRQLRRDGLEATLYAYVHDQQEGLLVNDLGRESPVDCTDLVGLGFKAYAGIPLLHQQQSLGSIALLTRQPRASTADNLALLAAIGDQVATAVVNAGLFQTITDERSRLQALIESSRDGIILVGMDQRILVTNVPALELLRLPGQPKDWTDQPIRDALAALKHHAPGAVQVTLKEMTRIQRGDESPSEGEYEISPHIIHWHNLPVMTNGTALGRLLVLRDVTEERALEKMREDLTRTMVHDLRNPLTAIFGALQFLNLTAGNLSEDQKSMLKIARNGTQGMLELVNNILDVSQLEGGRLRLVRKPVALTDLISEALRAQSPLATDKGLHLTSDVPPDLVPVWADAKLIGRVLQNLIDNAIKFTPSGGSVSITVKQTGDDCLRPEDGQLAKTPCVRVSVIDSGPGIPPELQSRLFQKFVTGRQAESGSGLGLAFCKLVIEAHGGQTWLDSDAPLGSDPGSGATFHFTLPVAPEESDVPATEPTMQSTGRDKIAV
jgi:signal transduction histidine kinase